MSQYIVLPNVTLYKNGVSIHKKSKYIPINYFLLYYQLYFRMSKKRVLEMKNNQLETKKLKKYAERWIIAQEKFTELARRQYSLIRHYINKCQQNITDRERRQTVKIICKYIFDLTSRPLSLKNFHYYLLTLLLVQMVSRLDKGSSPYLAEIDNFIQSFDETCDDYCGKLLF